MVNNLSCIFTLQIALWIWFLGCVITWKFGKVLLVEGMGVKSAEFIMLCMYSVGAVLFYLLPSVGKWVLLIVLLLWIIVQFFCHWYFTIFGASQKKIDGYNQCFEGTVRLFPVSEKRLIPDLYHIVLHILIVANIVGCIIYGW
ncbi:MAG: hypothetical protein K6A23_07240 [Butyrivibrio sp.]|nr:hypothetical protein [Butyrivibrio sp.]